MTAPLRIIRTLTLSVVLLAWTPALAAGTGYLGAWTITGSTRAPWADPAHPLDPAEPARLKGQAITFKAGAVAGPQPLACKGARYAFRDDTPDLLFQGAFDEMRSRDHRTDPAKLAASLGFKGPTIRTLETGCEIDFHFVDPSTAEFGLNDYVYTMRRNTSGR